MSFKREKIVPLKQRNTTKNDTVLSNGRKQKVTQLLERPDYDEISQRQQPNSRVLKLFRDKDAEIDEEIAELDKAENNAEEDSQAVVKTLKQPLPLETDVQSEALETKVEPLELNNEREVVLQEINQAEVQEINVEAPVNVEQTGNVPVVNVTVNVILQNPRGRTPNVPVVAPQYPAIDLTKMPSASRKAAYKQKRVTGQVWPPKSNNNG